MSEEIWKKFHNIEVSNIGNIKTTKHKDGTYTGFDHSNGYKQIQVRIDGKRKTYYIHRIVTHLFLNISLDSHLQVNHINAVRNDNRVENLEMVSNTENQHKRKSHISGRLFGTTKINYRKLSKPWRSQIKINGKIKIIGMYVTERLAHMVAVTHYIDAYGVKPHCTCDYCN
jgi:uncharacterized protein with FMN-binding domain